MKKNGLFLITLISFIFILNIGYASDNNDKLHFISSEVGDSIIVESNNHCGLIDALNAPSESTNDNGAKVKRYAQNIGCPYFDFIIMTHNHSDHIGGIPQLGVLVNEKTMVFYKEDLISYDSNNIVDDKEELLGYDNNNYYNSALQALNNKNAMTCDVTKANELNNAKCNLSTLHNTDNNDNSFISSVSYDSNNDFSNSENGYDTNLKENVYFDFGDFRINMYALSTISYHNENLNSIVTLVTHKDTGKKAVLTGDIALGPVDSLDDTLVGKSNLINNPTGSCSECNNLGIENQMADVIGKVDILKSANHGRDKSNSLYAISKYAPKYYIITGGNTSDAINRSNILAITYLKNKYNTNSYLSSQTEGAIVAQFNNDISILNYGANGSKINDALEDVLNSTFTDGWVTSYNRNINDYVYGYVDRNHPAVDKFILDTDLNDNVQRTYRFDNNGLMITGLFENGDSNYYFYDGKGQCDGHTCKIGEMLSGWQEIDGYKYYFRKSTDDGSGGANGSMIVGFANIDNNTYYFRKTENEGSTGPVGSLLTSACIDVGNNNYCFDEDGIVTNSVKFIEIPNANMCNTNVEYIGEEQVVTKEPGEGYVWGNNVQVESNMYIVTAILKDNYVWLDGTTEQKKVFCSIEKVRLDQPTINETTFTYTGNKITPEINNFNSTQMNMTGTTSATNAGDYVIEISLKNENSVSWLDGSTDPIIFNWTINKTDIPAPSVTDYEGIYDGVEHTFIVDPVTVGTVKYSTDNENWSTVKPTRKKVGTTNVYVKVFGDDNHYDSSTVTTKIKVMSDPNYSIEDFDVDYVNRYLTDVKVNTTYDDLKNKITLASGYSVEIDYIEKNGKKLLYTGGKVKIMNGSTVYKEFAIVVMGDTTGDGEINSADLLRIRQHLLRTRLLTGAYFLASDVNPDTSINSADLLRIRQHLLGTRYIN